MISCGLAPLAKSFRKLLCEKRSLWSSHIVMHLNLIKLNSDSAKSISIIIFSKRNLKSVIKSLHIGLEIFLNFAFFFHKHWTKTVQTYYKLLANIIMSFSRTFQIISFSRRHKRPVLYWPLLPNYCSKVVITASKKFIPPTF